MVDLKTEVSELTDQQLKKFISLLAQHDLLRCEAKTEHPLGDQVEFEIGSCEVPSPIRSEKK